MKRDYYVTFFPDLKNDWNQEELNNIPPETFNKPYSPKFVDYLLGDVPQIMESWKYFIEKNPAIEEGPLHEPVILDLYELYNILRNDGTLPQESAYEPEEIKNNLRKFLKKLQETPAPELKDDSREADLFRPHNRIKLILVVKQLLGYEDVETDALKQPTFKGLDEIFTPLVEILGAKDILDIKEKVIENFKVPEEVE